MGVVQHRAGEDPPGVDAGQVQGPGELALQGAADIASNSSRTAVLYRPTPSTRSPCRSRPSSYFRIDVDAARYSAHSPPEAARTRRRAPQTRH